MQRRKCGVKLCNIFATSCKTYMQALSLATRVQTNQYVMSVLHESFKFVLMLLLKLFLRRVRREVQPARAHSMQDGHNGASVRCHVSRCCDIACCQTGLPCDTSCVPACTSCNLLKTV